MTTESALREQLATCTRIFTMQQLVGIFGHVSVYQPSTQRILICPGAGSDKPNTRPEDVLVLDLDGKVLEGTEYLPIEWPIHTTLHAARADAIAIAHLHAPYATLFAIARREFRPVTLSGSKFGEGVPLYTDPKMVLTPDRGRRLVEVIGDKRAALLQAHGIVVIAGDLEELLYDSLILEDNARRAMQAATLGEVQFLDPEQCREYQAELKPGLGPGATWRYFARLESRWDRQPNTSAAPFG